jgi:MoxR-like ATPase
MAYEQVQALRARMQDSIIGQEDVVERLIIGLLANGNLLVEGLPGLAKTRAIKALAKNLEADFSRIQFTPDLLPSDVTGTEVYYQKDGDGEFRFEPGPIFANIVLGDEINRAPARHDAQDAAIIHGHGDAEPGGAGGHVPVARSANGSLPDARQYRVHAG